MTGKSRLTIVIDNQEELNLAIRDMVMDVMKTISREDADAALMRAIDSRVDRTVTATVERLAKQQVDIMFSAWDRREETKRLVQNAVNEYVIAFIAENYPPDKLKDLIRARVKAHVDKLMGNMTE